MRRWLLSCAIFAALAVLLAWLSGLETLPRGARFALKLAIALGGAALLGGGAARALLGPARARALAGNGTLLAVFALLSLGLGECATRVALRDVTTTSDNTSWFARRWRAQNTARSNALGYREREFDPIPAPGALRIAVVGDSLTYGQGVAEEERFTNRLEARLHEAGTRAEVLNFGRPGAETVDHVAMLRRDVLPVAPDYVLLQWFVNDVEGDDKSDRSRPMRLLPSDYLTEVLHEHSALYFLVSQSWTRLQTAAGWMESYHDNLRRRYGDPAGPGARAARGALEAFFALCRERGVPAGLVVFPGFTEDLAGDYELGFLLDRALETCRRAGARCLDLRPVYAPIEPMRDLWVNRFDSHPSPTAHALAADAIYEHFGDAF